MGAFGTDPCCNHHCVIALMPLNPVLKALQHYLFPRIYSGSCKVRSHEWRRAIIGRPKVMNEMHRVKIHYKDKGQGQVSLPTVRTDHGYWMGCVRHLLVVKRCLYDGMVKLTSGSGEGVIGVMTPSPKALRVSSDPRNEKSFSTPPPLNKIISACTYCSRASR